MIFPSGAPGMRQSVKQGILALLVLRLGMAALPARSVCVASSSQHKGVIPRINSGASKHFMSDISLFHSLDERAAHISFSTAAGTLRTSRAVGIVKFITKDNRGDFRIITLENVFFAPQQQHNLVAVCQLTHRAADTWESPDFEACTWQDAAGVVYPLTYAQNGYIWNLLPMSELGVITCDGIIVPKSLATIRSQTHQLKTMLCCAHRAVKNVHSVTEFGCRATCPLIWSLLNVISWTTWLIEERLETSKTRIQIQ